MTMSPARIVLAIALFALSVLFATWFHDDRHRLAAWLVFTLPPLLMLAGVLLDARHRSGAKAAFWAGVFGLFWFSHGVMAAWSRPVERNFACVEIALAITIILASSWPGLRGRFRKRR